VFLWWGKDNKAKRGCLVVQEVGLKGGEKAQEEWQEYHVEKMVFLWWGKDNKAKRGCLVVQEVGLKGRERAQEEWREYPFGRKCSMEILVGRFVDQTGLTLCRNQWPLTSAFSYRYLLINRQALLEQGIQNYPQNVRINGVGTGYSLPPKGTSYSLPPEGTGYFLPPDGTSYSLPPERTSYSLLPEGTSYSLVPKETLLLIMSIYDFLCLPSLDKVTIREEPHRLNTSILGRVTNRTTSPALVGTVIPHTSLEEIYITRPDHKVVTKADHAAKQKASTMSEISTNVAKKTRSNKKGSRADKEVKAHAELSEGVRKVTQASFCASHAHNTHPLDTDAGADEIASDGNVNPYYEAQVGNTVGDVLERDVLSFISGPYYIPYPYDEGSRSESPPYTKEDWEEFMESILVRGRKNFIRILRFLKSGEFNRAFASVLNTTISVGVERGFHMDHIDEEFRELSQRVVGFIPDAKEKVNRVIAAFLDTTFPFLDKSQLAEVAPPNHQWHQFHH
nr:hypothetical protein [Tanacetum cinerariifolium]